MSSSSEAPTYKAISRKWRRNSPTSSGSNPSRRWEDIRAATIAKLDLREMLAGILGSVTSFGSGIFLVVVYAFFLGAERRSLADKLAAAFPRGDQERTARLIDDINRRIGDYLAIKTLINVILGVVSYLIMLFMGLDFAVFWAVLIALGNYIPYVGTLAVLFPIVFSLAQFGSLATTLILAALLDLGANSFGQRARAEDVRKAAQPQPVRHRRGTVIVVGALGAAGRDSRDPADLDARYHFRCVPGDPLPRRAPGRADRRGRERQAVRPDDGSTGKRW